MVSLCYKVHFIVPHRNHHHLLFLTTNGSGLIKSFAEDSKGGGFSKEPPLAAGVGLTAIWGYDKITGNF
jgi:hypothetical protein